MVRVYPVRASGGRADTKTEPVVALARGVRHLVADSDGQLIPNPSHLERALKRLARAQRVVSRLHVLDDVERRVVTRRDRQLT